MAQGTIQPATPVLSKAGDGNNHKVGSENASEPQDHDASIGEQSPKPTFKKPGTNKKPGTKRKANWRARKSTIGGSDDEPSDCIIAPRAKAPRGEPAAQEQIRKAKEHKKQQEEKRRSLLESDRVKALIAAYDGEGADDYMEQLLDCEVDILSLHKHDMQKLKACLVRDLTVQTFAGVFSANISKETIETLVPAMCKPPQFAELLEAGMTRNEGKELAKVKTGWQELGRLPMAEVLSLLRHFQCKGDVIEHYGPAFLRDLDERAGLAKIVEHLNSSGAIKQDTREISGAHTAQAWSDIVTSEGVPERRDHYEFFMDKKVGRAQEWKYCAWFQGCRYPARDGVFTKTVYPGSFTAEHVRSILCSAIVQRRYPLGRRSSFQAEGQNWTLTTTRSGRVEQLW